MVILGGTGVKHGRPFRSHFASVSLNDPDRFWAEAAETIDWYTRWDRVCDASRAPFYRWFPAPSEHVLQRARPARRGWPRRAGRIDLRQPGNRTVRTFTFASSATSVAKFAGALASLASSKGDRVIIYMPMIPEAVIAMLAAARLGAIHSVVFGGFASPELAARIDDAQPKVVVTASCGIEPGRGGAVQAAARRGDRDGEA